LNTYIPVKLETIGLGENSNIGDNIINKIHLGENVILITDGQVNKGKTLGDASMYALSINATLNAIRLRQTKKDANVIIAGPQKTVSDVNNEFKIKINNPSNLTLNLKVSIDDNIVYDQTTKKDIISINQKFYKGTHTIKAEITDENNEDIFPQNNVFYKTIQVVPKPKILFITQKKSPLEPLLKELYITDVADSLPADISEYFAVILNDIPAFTNNEIEILNDFIIKGNGLFVIGGEHSYNLGQYKNKLIETLLPVNIGLGEKKQGDINIVMLIDISGSSKTAAFHSFGV